MNPFISTLPVHPPAMKLIARRRLRNLVATVVCGVGIIGYARWNEAYLQRSEFATGYLLLACLVFLALYNLRKKLPILAWTTSAGWLQAHIYVGLGSAILCGTHVAWRIPNGFLETTLAVLYVATFLSGLVGLYWTRTIPPRLTVRRDGISLRTNPRVRKQVQNLAEQSVLETVRGTGSNTLGDFFTERLQGYLEKPRGWDYWLRPTSKVRKRLLAELTEVTRYLSEPERIAGEKLFALIRQRDDLDFHAAMQWRLKAWLFVHLGLTYPLLLVACLHGWLAHLFWGGAA